MPKDRLRPALGAATAVALVVALAAPRVILTALFLVLALCTAVLVLIIVALVKAPRTDAPSFVQRQHDATRRLAFACQPAWPTYLSAYAAADSEDQTFQPVYGLTSAKVSSRLDTLLGLIRGSFIMPWYVRISPSRAFPDAVERNVRTALSSVAQRVEVVDWPSLVVSRVLPIVTDHLQHFKKIEHLATPPGSRATASLPLPLSDHAHPALARQIQVSAEGNIPSVEAHLRGIVERIVAEVMPAHEQSDVVSSIVREIVLGAILMPVFNMLCDSDFWNRQIDEQGAKYLYRRKQVNQVLSALSAVPASPSPSTIRKQHGAAIITVHSTTRQFDNFMRSIPSLKTLGEARRLRADVNRELRSARAAQKVVAAAAAANPQGDQTALRRADRYIRRLERARTHIDRRIATLSGGHSARTSLVPTTDSPTVSRFVDTNLYTILSDPSSLAFWLEYMERRGRAHLVQFWLLVEGFKDPLESSGQMSALENAEGEEPRPGANDATIGGDTAFLHVTYFAKPNGNVAISPKLISEISYISALAGPLSPTDVVRAKRALYRAQKAVYDQMEDEDWKEFQASELYLKALQDLKEARVVKARPSMRSVSYSPPPSPSVPKLVAPAAPPTRRLSDNPALPRRPYLVNGSFTPGASAAATTAVTTQLNAPMRKVTPDSMHSGGSASGSPRATSVPVITTPPPPPAAPHARRRSTAHLDFLMGGDDQATDRLFEDEEEDEAVLLEAQRMDAIQAALNEIIANGDDNRMSSPDLRDSTELPLHESTSSPLRKNSSSFTPTPPEFDPLSASVELVRPERHPLAGHKLTSRSAEDLQSLKDVPVASPVRRVTQFDARAARQRRPRRSSVDMAPSARSNKNIFDDEGDILEDVPDVPEVADDDDDDDGVERGGSSGGSVLFAAPGDLQLSVEIGRLAKKIAEITQQDALLGQLIRQAELTGNDNELKLLQRSRSSLEREQRTAEFQIRQFKQQEEENRLVPGRTKVMIPSTSVSGDEGRQVVRYNVELRQVDPANGRVRLSWIVSHRYNEFWELDRAIREQAAVSNNATLVEDVRTKLAEIPGKRLVPSLSTSFVETRRAGLEKYLQSVLRSEPLCESSLVRGFLSQSTAVASDLSSSTASLAALPTHLVKTLYKTVTSSLDEALVPSMFDLMSQSLQRQISEVAGGIGAVTDVMPSALRGGPWWQASPVTVPSALPRTSSTASITTSPTVTSPTTMSSMLPAWPGMQPLDGESAAGYFTAPICDLFIELFDLKENNWLRRQAIVLILQQVLGGTIERKARDTFRTTVASEKGFDKVLRLFQDALWPGGVRKEPTPPRTDAEKHESRLGASRKLALLMPDVAANMIGRGNARRAAARVFGTLQDTKLNQHLVLSIMDEIFGALFPAPGLK